MHSNDRRRTPPAEVFAAPGIFPDCHVISLVPGRALPGIVCPTRPLTNYAETAALIAALDLVITVDTAVAHLAGAMGRPVWLLNRFDTDWRWMDGSDDSIWYPTLRQFRQRSLGDWADVIERVALALPEFSAG